MEGDDHDEAYTVIVWGVGLSHEILEIAGAKTFVTAEGNMCGAVMRGTVALPGSKRRVYVQPPELAMHCVPATTRHPSADESQSLPER